MYETIKIDDKEIKRYYIVQWRSEPYTLQEEKNMKHYEPPIKAYVG